MDQRTCRDCGAAYIPTSGHQFYCQNPCAHDRHRKVEMPCDSCGSICLKAPSAGTRYKGVYCSMLCRDYMRWGGQSKALPANHWARWYGSTSEWSPPEAKPNFQAGMCRDCDALIVEPATNTPSSYCGEACATRAAKRRRRAREHNAPGSFRWVDVMRQYTRQGRVCAYCQVPVAGLPEPEHVLPLSRGGRNDMSNLVAACSPCNSDKADLTLSEWAIDRALRGRPTVRTILDGEAFTHLWHRPPTGPATRSAPTKTLAKA